jgi:hypothetical protein
MFDKITNAIGPKVGTVALTARRYSPELGVVGGLVALGAAGVMLARAHKRSDYLGYNHAMRLDDLHANLNELEEATGLELDSRQVRVAEMKVHAEFGYEVAKLYGPSIAVAAVGAILVLGAHRIQSNRIRGLAAALVVVQQAFDTYRERVVAEMGPEADERFLWGYSQQSVTKLIQGEDGKTTKKKVSENVAGEEFSPAMYNRVFDSHYPMWSPSEEVTEAQLRGAQGVFNDWLSRKGYVFLNDVYEALGFAQTEYGQVVGWSQAAVGHDQHIDIGLDSIQNQNRKAGEPWMLTFNVDGYILDKMV